MALAALFVVATSHSTLAEDGQASLEYPVKASLLLNFAKFTEWPQGSAQAGSPSVAICVLGPDPFGRVLDSTVGHRTVGGRPVEVKRFGRLEGIEACHVLFIPSSEAPRMPQILARIGEAPVLTVGESGDFNERGGVIRLSVEDNHARFSVDLGPTEGSHLKLSSKLLGVARSVRVGARQ